MRIANRNAHEYVANLSGFKGNNLDGTTVCHGAGRLPTAWRDLFYAAEDEGRLEYIVYSYWTPIAWHTKDEGWVVPPVKYSPTTSKHLTQTRVRDLISA